MANAGSKLLLACGLILLTVAPGIHTPAMQSGTVYSWLGSGSILEGSPIGNYWTCLWLGYGTGKLSGGQLYLTPKASATVGETHSALVQSDFALNRVFDISVDVVTDKQLRTVKVGKKSVAAPNPWEVAWIVANMPDDGSGGIYFMLKPNGVELGGFSSYGAHQTFLYTAPAPALVLGRLYKYRLKSDGTSIWAYVNGVEVARSSLSPVSAYALGDKLGLYTEDAAVRFGPVTVY
jgi:hypothetical protein